ncbi:MAG: hypothetical protein LBT59_20425 [Clostridiales bacterium]|jgi:hypothetical protein|nr:hypothetical protein [Clostridiales bacterium]
MMQNHGKEQGEGEGMEVSQAKGAGNDGILINEMQQESFWNISPKWSFENFDFEHDKWSFKNLKTPSVLLRRLQSYEFQTLGDMCSRLGVGNTRSHYIFVDQLCAEARKRISELKTLKEDVDFKDKLFSLYLTSKERLWGIIRNDGTFSVIWYDPRHEVYPVTKRHT